jgi:hypothetical protein
MAWTTPGTATAGEVLTASFWNTNVRDNLNILAGVGAAWTAWTPQIDQGATTNIAKTVDDARYLRLGTLMVATFNLVPSANGTAGANVVIGNLPVASVRTSGGFKFGVGGVFDTSTGTSYAAVLSLITSTSVCFVGDWSGVSAWGTSPNIALASGDRLTGILIYECATAA